ncbi:MAG: hypothetical protein AB9866_21520 [Syntrophobacteraceae bacterium]
MALKPVNDVLQIRIEEDGTITTVSGKMSAEVHQAADEFLESAHQLMGGERKDTRLAQQHSHTHHHTHDHKHLHEGGSE